MGLERAGEVVEEKAEVVEEVVEEVREKLEEKEEEVEEEADGTSPSILDFDCKANSFIDT